MLSCWYEPREANLYIIVCPYSRAVSPYCCPITTSVSYHRLSRLVSHLPASSQSSWVQLQACLQNAHSPAGYSFIHNAPEQEPRVRAAFTLSCRFLDIHSFIYPFIHRKVKTECSCCSHNVSLCSCCVSDFVVILQVELMPAERQTANNVQPRGPSTYQGRD